VNLSIEKYNDKVLCDVVPMTIWHQSHSDGFTIKISFLHNNNNIILKPLSSEVCENQMKLREQNYNKKEI